VHPHGRECEQSGELQDEFCYMFSHSKHINFISCDLFDFEQLECESIGVAWARFSHLIASSPGSYIPYDEVLHTFSIDLDMTSARSLDIVVGGSFAQKTTMEGIPKTHPKNLFLPLQP
jgi:hypothetical protein